MKIATIVGARPQFIKAAAVSRVLDTTLNCQEVLIHTGQHYDDNMARVFFQELEVSPPAYNLGIGSASHAAQTGRMLVALEEVLLIERPDWVLVYGDTNSTLAGALAASKLHHPVCHVEAGLRSFNRRMPEEINRVLTDHAADCLFAPTTNAVRNLKHEGIPSGKIHQVGDVMYDAALHYGAAASVRSAILADLQLNRGGYVLATVHRAENTDSGLRLESILEGLGQVAQETPVVFPLHPRTRKALKEIHWDALRSVIRFIEPVGYLDMIMLEKNAALIATDSGGVQKEAFFYCVPCVTLREETEWTELIELGWNRLVPPVSPSMVASGLRAALQAPNGAAAAPYGNGHAAERIAEVLVQPFSSDSLLISSTPNAAASSEDRYVQADH